MYEWLFNLVGTYDFFVSLYCKHISLKFQVHIYIDWLIIAERKGSSILAIFRTNFRLGIVIY